MTPYLYEPLKATEKEFRLMTLRAGDFSDDIRVNLEAFPFPLHEKTPQYEALSYTWGNTADPSNITIEGAATALFTLGVTRNLAEALRYLRYKNKNRVLWIDAVSINQQDLLERSETVPRMGDVYSLASRVVVWLGLEDAESQHAFRLLEELGSRIAIDEVAMTTRPATEADRDWADISIPLPYSSKENQALASLFSRPWFERLWIQQEIYMAKDATVVCGLSTMPWQLFRRAAYCIVLKSSVRTSLSSSWGYLKHVNTIVYNGSGYADLGYTIWRGRHAKCSDQRDRIFGMLSMIHNYDQKRWSTKPTYTKTVRDIYEDVVYSYMAARGCLHTLQFCDLGNRDVKLALPSWVPDWSSMSCIAHRIFNGRASNNSSGSFRYENGGILHALGVTIGSIAKTDPIRISEYSSDADTCKEIARICGNIPLGETYPEKGFYLDAIRRTLVVDLFMERWTPTNPAFPSEEKAKTLFSNFMGAENASSDGSQPNLLDGPDYLRTVRRNADGRAVITMNTGHLGLAPTAAQPNDLICVLLGCRVPLVIRPVSGKSPRYRIVGDCYADSFMRAEAFLGRLPDSVQIISKYDENRGYSRSAFFNQQTSETQFDDPRYDTVLSPGWEKQYELPKESTDEDEEDRNRELILAALALQNIEPTWFAFE